ncbi:MAG TPA: hypothetical protein VGI91_03985 [Steroidobacteraceae bacterium]|jgi:hypothetical protein
MMFIFKESSVRYLALAIAVVFLGVCAPTNAQQSGPVAAVGGDSGDSSDSIFPLWKSLLGDKKFLPPYGFNLVLLDLSGQWDVKDFSAAVNGNELVALNGRADVHPFTYGARADVWLLPFLNVFTVFGGVKMKIGVVGYDLPLGVGGVPPEVIRGDVNFNLDFTGYYGGGGFVLMYAYQNLFTSVDYSTVWTHLQSATTGVEGNEVRTDTASVRLGYNAGAVQPYIGARWVKKIDHFEGTVEGPNGSPVTFAVDLRAPAWNYTAGIHAMVFKHYELIVEAGFGDRTHGLVNLGYRF